MKHRTKVILGLAAVLLLAGCGKGEKAETPASTVSEKSQGQYVAGTYLGKGVGYARGLQVEVVVSESRIESVEVKDNNETTQFIELASAELPKAIVKAQSTEVDAVAGATKSSQGIIEGVNAALEQAKTQ